MINPTRCGYILLPSFVFSDTIIKHINNRKIIDYRFFVILLPQMHMKNNSDITQIYIFKNKNMKPLQNSATVSLLNNFYSVQSSDECYFVSLNKLSHCFVFSSQNTHTRSNPACKGYTFLKALYSFCNPLSF